MSPIRAGSAALSVPGGTHLNRSSWAHFSLLLILWPVISLLSPPYRAAFLPLACVPRKDAILSLSHGEEGGRRRPSSAFFSAAAGSAAPSPRGHSSLTLSIQGDKAR